MVKKKTLIVKLLSTAGTGFFYTATRNVRKQASEKLVLRKYDPIVRQHVLFTETKLKK